MKPSYKEVLAPNKVLNEHQVNRQPFWWRHSSSPWDGNESCFLPFVFKLLIPFLFWGNQPAGDQLKFFSFKHTNLPRPRNAHVGLPAPASRGETTCWRHSSFYWDSKGNNAWILLKQTETEKGRRNQALMVPQATAGAALPFYFTCDVTQLLKTSSSEIFCSLKSKVTQLMSGFHILREPPSWRHQQWRSWEWEAMRTSPLEGDSQPSTQLTTGVREIIFQLCPPLSWPSESRAEAGRGKWLHLASKCWR